MGAMRSGDLLLKGRSPSGIKKAAVHSFAKWAVNIDPTGFWVEIRGRRL